ncbi:hypothetical protein Sez_0896 [Streptococcus equi subsp. zooepidemicus MGCS10565]|uniref:Uncharacterized protein n=1 Tax=Streptococcus equi subsp. zooepidemicus (strain MGCS10565) TaxID=552526 RepID=B4U2N7_STREM|nr:hypothetical protein Sez_0896 [Streptococcus equi subsp. zooepidemicus MGCS10565]
MQVLKRSKSKLSHALSKLGCQTIEIEEIIMSEEKVNAKLEQAGGKIKEVAADAKDAVKGFVKGLKQDK